MTQPQLAVSVMDAARRLGVGRSTVYSLISTGRLPSIKIGRRRLVRVEVIHAFLADASGSAQDKNGDADE